MVIKITNKLPINLHVTSCYRYKILAPQAVDQVAGDPKKAAAAILDASGLDADQYRLGHTKACRTYDSDSFTL